MILIQASKPATHKIDDELMIVVFQQYLKSLRFNEPRMYRMEGRERTTYLFHIESTCDKWEPSYHILSKDIHNCNDLQVLITLAEFLNKSQS